MDTYVNDTYVDLQTRTLLHDHNGMTKDEKEKTFKVLKYLATQKKPLINNVDIFAGADKLRSEFTKCVNESESYDDLKNKIRGCSTDECLMAHAILSFHIEPKSLLMITTSIHTRAKPLNEGKNAWFDNFTLNSYLYQLSTFVYSDYDNNTDSSIFSITKPKNLINKNYSLSNPQSLLYNLGNLYRTFINFEIGSKEEIYKLNNGEATKKLDELVEKYPYFTYQCHGCDCFDINSKTCTLKDIREFTNRYPNTLVGGILNTETYRSGRGQHWMALLFLNGTAYLFCSQGSNFTSFHDNSNLVKQLNSLGFAELYNPQTIQKDNSNCGLFSVLSNLSAIENLDRLNSNLNLSGKDRMLDVTEIVKDIGTNANGYTKGGIYKLKESLIGWMSLLK